MIPESGAPLTMIRIRNPVTGISLESRIQDFLGYPCMKWLCWRGKGTREGRKPLDVCVGWQPRPQGFSLKNGWALGTRLRGPFCLVPSLKRSLFLHSARQSLCARSHHSPLALLACLQLSHVISRFISLSSLSAPHWALGSLWRRQDGRSPRCAQNDKEMYQKVWWRSGVFVSHLSS